MHRTLAAVKGRIRLRIGCSCATQSRPKVPLFAGIDEAELEEIASRAADIHLRAGDWLIQEGETPSFFMVLSGRLAVTKQVAGQEQGLQH